MRLFAALLVITALAAPGVQADNLTPLPGDPAKGKKLAQQKCSACHARMFGGDGSGIYTRPNRRVKSIEGLMGQVAMCDRQLDTHLSDEDKNDIIIFLNQAYYRF